MILVEEAFEKFRRHLELSAVRLEQQGKTGEAAALWREIMDKYFPTS